MGGAQNFQAVLGQLTDIQAASKGQDPETFVKTIEKFVANNKDVLGTLGDDIINNAQSGTMDMVRQIKELMVTEKEQLAMLNKQYEVEKKVADLSAQVKEKSPDLNYK